MVLFIPYMYRWFSHDHQCMYMCKSHCVVPLSNPALVYSGHQHLIGLEDECPMAMGLATCEQN